MNKADLVDIIDTYPINEPDIWAEVAELLAKRAKEHLKQLDSVGMLRAIGGHWTKDSGKDKPKPKAPAARAPVTDENRSMVLGHLRKSGPHKLSELAKMMPAFNQGHIRDTLKALRKDDLVTVSGRGVGAEWSIIAKGEGDG